MRGKFQSRRFTPWGGTPVPVDRWFGVGSSAGRDFRRKRKKKNSCSCRNSKPGQSLYLRAWPSVCKWYYFILQRGMLVWLVDVCVFVLLCLLRPCDGPIPHARTRQTSIKFVIFSRFLISLAGTLNLHPHLSVVCLCWYREILPWWLNGKMSKFSFVSKFATAKYC